MVAAIEVSWTAFEPSESASQILVGPERFEEKAIRRPSGDNWGSESVRVEAMVTMGGDNAGAPGAEVSTRQKFLTSIVRT